MELLGQVVRDHWMCRVRLHLRRFGNRLAESYGVDPIPKFDGGQDTDGRTRRAIWPDLARTMLIQQLDPADMAALSVASFRAARSPDPESMIGTAAIAEYQKQLPSKKQQMTADLAVQQRTADDRVWRAQLPPSEYTRDQACEYVLRCHNQELSPLFRFCLARAICCAELEQRYKHAAALQYMFTRGLHNLVWGDLIPPEIVEIFSQVECEIGV